MIYLVHINPTPGKDDRVVEVEADGFQVVDGHLIIVKKAEDGFPVNSGCFAKGIWNYVEPKK